MSAVGKTVYELSMSDTFPRSPILLPPVNITFAIPSFTVQYIHTSVQFHGWSDENPYIHLNRLRQICSTFKLNGVSDDAIYLRLFPLSLCDNALVWFDCLPMGSVTTWDDMVSKFLNRYFPRSKIGILRKQIYSFFQEDGETFHETWERFNELLAGCPPHGFDSRTQVEIFYEGLTVETRRQVDISTGWNMYNSKTAQECLEMFERLALCSSEYAKSRDYVHPGTSLYEQASRAMIEKTRRPETIMDIRVPPLVSRGFYYDDYCDDQPVLWSDEPEPINGETSIEVEEEMKEVVEDSKAVSAEGETGMDDSTEVVSEVSMVDEETEMESQEAEEDMARVEEESLDDPELSEIEKDHVLSWEEEFGEDMVDSPTPSEGEFDPLGDLKVLEDLLYQKPSVGIKEEECLEVTEAGTEKSLHEEVKEKRKEGHTEVEQPRHDPYSISIREVSRFHGVADGRKKEENRDQDVQRSLFHPPCLIISFSMGDGFQDYMLIIRFGPGKFKSCWFDVSVCFWDLERLAAGFFPTSCKQKVVRSIDGKRIKEKPPDSGIGSESG